MPINSFGYRKQIDLAEVATCYSAGDEGSEHALDLKDSKSQIAMEGSDADHAALRPMSSS